LTGDLPITITPITDGYNISLSSISSSSNGIVICTNGVLSVIPIGNGVLVGANGSISWVTTQSCNQ
jgi:hypothetical protein